MNAKAHAEAKPTAIEVTGETFPALMTEGIVLLDFWASWCGPCRAFAPVFEAAAARHPDVVFGKVDTEAQRNLSAAFEIRAIPTLAVIRDGIVLAVEPGMLTGSQIDGLVARVRALNMDEVRTATEGPTT